MAEREPELGRVAVVGSLNIDLVALRAAVLGGPDHDLVGRAGLGVLLAMATSPLVTASFPTRTRCPVSGLRRPEDPTDCQFDERGLRFFSTRI
jgi:hypothetical protein